MDAGVRDPLRQVRRVVVKVGTAVVTRADGRLALGRVGALAEALHEIRGRGVQVLLVSSGAIGLGAARLGLEALPSAVVDRQACAAAGQGALMALYEVLFRQLGETSAQVLLTEEDFLHRQRYLNLHATLERLLELGAVPVVNENDTVSTTELALGKDRVFGDNDRLSALVAAGVDADLLVLLTDVDGVHTGPPGQQGSERVPVFRDAQEIAFGERSVGGRGGMQAKVAAARVATRSGTQVVVASGMTPDVLGRVLDGDDVGTWFPAQLAFNKRRQWLAFATSPVGVLVVNEGARRALVERNASLLAAGVERVDGRFPAGAVVGISDGDGLQFARGICDLDADTARARAGAGDGRSKPLVHRDKVVILHVEEP